MKATGIQVLTTLSARAGVGALGRIIGFISFALNTC